MTDERLLKSMQAKEQNALGELISKYHRYIYTIIVGILNGAGRPEDVEELVQDVFLAVWDHADAIYAKKLKAYLGTTARNKAKSWLRSHRDLPMALDMIEIPDSDTSLEDAAIQRELAGSIRKALRV